MARSTLTLEEAEELAHFVIPAAPDVRLPARWCLSVDGVPVAPVPEVGTHLFARAVGLYRARLSPEELADPQYAPQQPRLGGPPRRRPPAPPPCVRRPTPADETQPRAAADRKSTRLNSSH